MKVIHCPHNIAGNPAQLARAERSLGVDSWAISFSNNNFRYDIDETLLFDSSPLANEVRRLRFIIKVMNEFSIVHYNFGSTIMPFFTPDVAGSNHKTKLLSNSIYNLYVKLLEQMDMRIFKLLGKAIFVTFQGDDARQGDYCINNYDIHFAHNVNETYYTSETDEHKRKLIKGFDNYCDGIYALNPDLLNVLPSRAKFLPYSSVDIENVAVNYVDNTVPLLLHAPSDRDVKGTKYIINAIERLRGEGVKFDFLLIENMPNKEAMELYKTADLLIDQVLAGWYGGLAVELMALGKPVMAYIREEDLKYIPVKMKDQLPIININPDTVYSSLKRYLTTEIHTLKEIGVKSREYVEEWHDPRKIASIVKNDYEAALNK